MSDLIQHPGVIINIKDKLIEVRIEQHTACADCHAKSACTVADKAEKIIEIPATDDSFKVGDNVIIFEKKSVGMKAVLFAYVLPMLIVFLTLALLVLMNKSDIFAGTVALAMLVPYYVIFFLCRNKLKKTFVFSIRKEEESN